MIPSSLSDWWPLENDGYLLWLGTSRLQLSWTLVEKLVNFAPSRYSTKNTSLDHQRWVFSLLKSFGTFSTIDKLCLWNYWATFVEDQTIWPPVSKLHKYKGNPCEDEQVFQVHSSQFAQLVMWPSSSLKIIYSIFRWRRIHSKILHFGLAFTL
jgi:hypothetical protein